MNSPDKSRLSVVTPIVVKPGVDIDKFLAATEVILEPIFLGWKFAQTPVDQLVDSIALAKKFFTALEKWIKGANEAMKTRVTLPSDVGAPTIQEGRQYKAVVSKRERVDIDREKVKAEMGEKWYAEHCSVTSYYEIRYSLSEGGKEGNDDE